MVHTYNPSPPTDSEASLGYNVSCCLTKPKDKLKLEGNQKMPVWGEENGEGLCNRVRPDTCFKFKI